MPGEIVSIAIFELLPGSEAEALETTRALLAALAKGGYCRDLMYRDPNSPNLYVLVRYWKSEQARRAALEDTEVLRCYAKLAHEVRTIKVYETLEEVEL
jgi:quinol monooxygenase YgiN